MTKYRITETVRGRRIATEGTFDTKTEAQNKMWKINWQNPGTNARVVKDSARVRGMIP